LTYNRPKVVGEKRKGILLVLLVTEEFTSILELTGKLPPSQKTTKPPLCNSKE